MRSRADSEDPGPGGQTVHTGKYRERKLKKQAQKIRTELYRRRSFTTGGLQVTRFASTKLGLGLKFFL